MKTEDLALVVLEMAELVKKFGKVKAGQILDCLSAIQEATKDFPDDVKDDAIKWVLDVARKSLPVSVPNDSNTVKTSTQ